MRFWWWLFDDEDGSGAPPGPTGLLPCLEDTYFTTADPGYLTADPGYLTTAAVGYLEEC